MTLGRCWMYKRHILCSVFAHFFLLFSMCSLMAPPIWRWACPMSHLWVSVEIKMDLSLVNFVCRFGRRPNFAEPGSFSLSLSLYARYSHAVRIMLGQWLMRAVCQHSVQYISRINTAAHIIFYELQILMAEMRKLKLIYELMWTFNSVGTFDGVDGDADWRLLSLSRENEINHGGNGIFVWLETATQPNIKQCACKARAGWHFATDLAVQIPDTLHSIYLATYWMSITRIKCGLCVVARIDSCKYKWNNFNYKF